MSIQTQAQLLCFNEDHITSITAIKAESLPTNVYLQIYVPSVKFLYVFTICVQIYIIVVKLITIHSCITSFAYLRISVVRLTNNVQRNLYRCVQTVFITYLSIYLSFYPSTCLPYLVQMVRLMHLAKVNQKIKKQKQIYTHFNTNL